MVFFVLGIIFVCIQTAKWYEESDYVLYNIKAAVEKDAIPEGGMVLKRGKKNFRKIMVAD